jgi:hypothetical protein
MYQNTIPSTAHDGVLKVAAEAEALAQPTAVLISGDDRKTDDEGFRAHGSTLAQELETQNLGPVGCITNRFLIS